MATLGIRPILNTSDLEGTISDLEKIGFKVNWCYGNPIFFAGLSINNFEMHLRETKHPIPPVSQLYVSVDNVDGIQIVLQSKGIETKNGPFDQEYGMRDFEAHLAGGTIIVLGQSLSD